MASRNSGMIWNRAGKTLRSNNGTMILSPPSLKYRPEEHPDSTRIKRNLKMQNFELMWYQIISTATLNKVLTWALHSQREKIYILKFSLARGCVLSSRVSTHTPVFSGTDCTLVGKPSPQTPKGWGTTYTCFSLPESMRKRLTAQWDEAEQQSTSHNAKMPGLACPGREMFSSKRKALF